MVIMCDEIIEEIVPTNFNEKKSNLKNTKFLYFTCIFIIAVSIYCYLMSNIKQNKNIYYHFMTQIMN